MTILNGIILAVGGLMMAVPIILHLLMQPKPKLITFPALRFIIRHERANKRQLQVKNWLLLLLRCLAILAVAVALAQPSVASSTFGAWLTLSGVAVLGAIVAALLVAAVFWLKPLSRLLVGLLAGILAIVGVVVAMLVVHIFREEQPAILGDREAPVAAVILIDNSPRMGYLTENQTILHRAKTLGEWLIGQLPLASQVSIVTPDGDEPFYSVDLNAAKKRLATLDIVYRDISIPAAILPSLQLLQNTEPTRKELYVITDLSKASWPSRDQKLRQALADRPDVSLYVLDVGMENPRNIELHPLRQTSSAITPSGQLEIQATVESLEMAEPRVVQLKLEQPDAKPLVRRDGKTLLPEKHWERSATVELLDSRTVDVSFQLGQLPAGVHHGWVEIEGGDALPIDNRRYFTIEVRPAWKTLVVHPDNVSPNNFIETVAPLRQRESGTAEFVCDVITQRELSSRSLADYRMVALLNPEPVSDAIWSEIRKYVDQGGGLLCCVGHNAAAAGVASPTFNTAAAQQVLPSELTEVWRAPGGDVFLSPTEFSHPILAEFRGRASSTRWNRLPVYLHWGVQRSAFDTGEPVEILLRYNNRRPAILEKRIGKGRVILMTTPITEPPRPTDHPSWNELFYGDETWASWLIVLQSAKYLVQTDSQALNFEIDQTVVLANDSRILPRDYWLFSPRDEEPVKLATESEQLRYRFTNVPGNYRLRDSENGTVRRGFSVNLRPQATRLNRMEKPQLDNLLGEDRYRLARGQTEIKREQGVARIGQEFYPLLALFVAAILALEFLLSTLFYRTQATATASPVASGTLRPSAPPGATTRST